MNDEDKKVFLEKIRKTSLEELYNYSIDAGHSRGSRGKLLNPENEFM
jgi:hypothetical protein